MYSSLANLMYMAVVTSLSGHVSEMITIVNPALPSSVVETYADTIAKESIDNGLEPETVVAVMWHESDFKNLPRNKTNDYGVLQVHFTKRHTEYWLDGLTKYDLMDPETNIKAGIEELAFWKQWHETKSRQYSHSWVGHYKYGCKIKSRRYEQRVLRKREFLLNLDYEQDYIQPQ